MKKVLCMMAMLAMAAAIMMTVTGCASKHESEYDEHQKEVEEALEEYVKDQKQVVSGPEDKKPDPNLPETDIVMIYSLASGNTGLNRELDEVPELDDYELTEKLIEYKVLPEGAEVVEYEPDEHIIGYAGLDGLTTREAMAIINTFSENLNSDGLWELKVNGETVMKSAYSPDWETIDDSYEGNEDFSDSEVSSGGPGVE